MKREQVITGIEIVIRFSALLTIIFLYIFGISYALPPLFTQLALSENPFAIPISLGLIFWTLLALYELIYPWFIVRSIRRIVIWLKKSNGPSAVI